jgi:hypothetical protein
MTGALWAAIAVLWVSALFFIAAHHHQRRLRLEAERTLRELRCDCGGVLAYQEVCVDLAGWHHGHGAGHCHPLDTVDR